MHLASRKGSIEQIQNLSATELIAWSLDNFDREKIVLSSGFGMEGCALIDMAARQSATLDVHYLDTGFFFPQTYELIDELKERYANVTFIDSGTRLTPAEQENRYGPRLWERDSDVCCLLRKVLPMRELLKDAEVWITGVRSDQSPQRRSTRRVEWNSSHEVWKVAPLSTWTRSQVWEYIQAHQVPHNLLHHEGYPSIGCMQCTKKVPGVSVQEYSRQGRWSGSAKTECGLHL